MALETSQSKRAPVDETCSSSTGYDVPLVRTLQILPGLALAAAIGWLASQIEPHLASFFAGRFIVPAVVIALLLGVAASPLAARPVFNSGLAFTIKTLLRWSIAGLGARVALSDISALGALSISLIVASMAGTVAGTYWLSYLVGTGRGFGLLAGAANAVCGASATLATAAAIPSYPMKSADVVFAVIAANAISTVAMLTYPWLATLLGLNPAETGLLLGATIHDMAQVVAAGYATSEAVGANAVVVKLFRVMLLLPVVLVIGYWVSTRWLRGVSPDAGPMETKVPVPVFAFVFVALALVNTWADGIPFVGPVFAATKPWLILLSGWGLVLSIAALGLGTSIGAIRQIGLAHASVFLGGTVIILGLVVAGIYLMRTLT